MVKFWETACGLCATSLFLPHFDVICDLTDPRQLGIYLFNRHTDEVTGNLFSLSCPTWSAGFWKLLEDYFSLNKWRPRETLNRSCLQVRNTEKARQKYFLATVKMPKCLTTRVFLCVAETIVGSLLCCSVGIVQCLINLCIASFGDWTRPQNQETTHNYKNADVILRNRTNFARTLCPVERVLGNFLQVSWMWQ